MGIEESIGAVSGNIANTGEGGKIYRVMNGNTRMVRLKAEDQFNLPQPKERQNNSKITHE